MSVLEISKYNANHYEVIAYEITNYFGFTRYIINITEKNSDYKLELASHKYDYQSVQEVANAIAHLIGMPDISGEHYTPDWCKEFFT